MNPSRALAAFLFGIALGLLVFGCSSRQPPAKPVDQLVITEPLIVRAFPAEGGTLVIHFHGDVDFTPDERKTIERALVTLRGATSWLYEPEVSWDCDMRGECPKGARLVREDSNAEWVSTVALWQGWEMPILGVTLDVDGDLTVVLMGDQLTDARWLQHTAMHELLHAAGLADVEREGNVMSAHMCYERPGGYKACYAALELGDQDKAQFCEVRDCRVKDLP
jgi:hypothetical protein